MKHHFNLDFQVNRQYIYDIEYVKSEMEIKTIRYKQSNPNSDVSEAEIKISKLANVQTYLLEFYELCEKLKKENQRLNLENEKLLAIYNHSKL